MQIEQPPILHVCSIYFVTLLVNNWHAMIYIVSKIVYLQTNSLSGEMFHLLLLLKLSVSDI